MRKHILAVIAAILVLALATVVMAADPHVGTWKMNAAKSKFNPGPPFKSDTLTFAAQDNGIKLMEGFVEADGKSYHLELAAKYDGKDYPVAGDPVIDTVAMKKVDANTFDVVLKKTGKEMFRCQEVFSKDGKTLTLTEKGKNPQGQINNTKVFEKQ